MRLSPKVLNACHPRALMQTVRAVLNSKHEGTLGHRSELLNLGRCCSRVAFLKQATGGLDPEARNRAILPPLTTKIGGTPPPPPPNFELTSKVTRFLSCSHCTYPPTTYLLYPLSLSNLYCAQEIHTMDYHRVAVWMTGVVTVFQQSGCLRPDDFMHDVLQGSLPTRTLHWPYAILHLYTAVKHRAFDFDKNERTGHGRYLPPTLFGDRPSKSVLPAA